MDIADNVPERRIPTIKNHVKKLQQLHQRLCEQLIKSQEHMTCYYNSNHVSKQFKVEDFVKLSTKYLKFKHHKLSSCWVGLFRVLEQISDQTYHLTLFIKYFWLHNVFLIQLLKSYHCYEDDDSLIAMPDLEDPQDK